MSTAPWDQLDLEYWCPTSLKEYASFSCVLLVFYRCLVQGIFVQLVPDPDDMDLTMLIADIEALFAIGLCGVALIGVNKKSFWCFYLPSMLFTPIDGVYCIVFGAMCIQYELYWFGAGIICINLFLIFYMVTLVDLAIHHAHPDDHVPQWRRALPTFRKTRPQENVTAV